MCNSRYAVPILSLLMANAASAAETSRLRDVNLEDRANGMLALMSYAMTPDLTSSSLSINDNSAGNPSLTMTQAGGGSTLGKEVPIYLEGAVAYSRYDPRFVATDGEQTQTIPVKWNSISATGGIGYDFPLTDELALRPIFNFAAGYLTSDINAARLFINRRFDRDIKFLDNGHMTAVGLGGALMLDLERVRPNYELDVELRYSYMNLQNVGGKNDIDGQAIADSVNLYTRWRAPTGLMALQRPLRYVLEVSHSEYLGDQRGVLGFDRLSTVGAGLELDSSAYDVFITRTRLVVRHVMGDHVSGVSVGLACSF
ncbi:MULTISPECIES: autotransporter domain-containing protein [unclassified Pseudomonas]|uniref:Autotransporter domain-containing protein n=1 Tax=Pseudomonas sp. MYb327 TaxID=2745230 RepID=A0AAU8E8Y2_9PSED